MIILKVINVVNFSSNLITSIISLIIGVILFSRPDLVTIAISYVLGTLLIICGIGKIIFYSYQKGKDTNTSTGMLVSGIVLIFFGLMCIFFSNIIEQIIRFIIGGFILLSGINRLIKAINVENKKDYRFIASIIVSLILIFIGIYVIFISNLVFSSLGIILIIYSVIEIINYIIMASNSNVVLEKTSDSKLKTIEVKEKKNNKKKDKN